MKKTLLIVVLLIGGSAATFGQVSCGVSPGIGFSGAHFGIRPEGKRLAPYIALQFVGFKYSFEDKQPISGGSSEELTKLTLFLPNVGMKYYLHDEEQLKTFLNFSIAKPFVTGKREVDGTSDPDFEDDLKRTKVFATELSFGAEYFLHEHFSLGGEFGLRTFHYKYDGESYLDKVNVSPTFSRISLNYYF